MLQFSLIRHLGGLSLRRQPRKHNSNSHTADHNNRCNSRTKLMQRRRIMKEDKNNFKLFQNATSPPLTHLSGSGVCH